MVHTVRKCDCTSFPSRQHEISFAKGFWSLRMPIVFILQPVQVYSSHVAKLSVNSYFNTVITLVRLSLLVIAAAKVVSPLILFCRSARQAMATIQYPLVHKLYFN